MADRLASVCSLAKPCARSLVQVHDIPLETGQHLGGVLAADTLVNEAVAAEESRVEFHVDIGAVVGHVGRIEVNLQGIIGLAVRAFVARPLPGDAVAHEDGPDAAGTGQEHGPAAIQVPDGGRPGLLLRPGRYGTFGTRITIGERSPHGIGAAERQRGMPADTRGNRCHRVGALLRATRQKRSPVRTRTALGTSAVAIL